MASATVHVPVGGGYDVMIGPGVLGALGAAARRACPGARRAFLVHDAAIPDGLVRSASRSLQAAGMSPFVGFITAHEQQKSIGVVERLLVGMATAKLERGEPVVALGGGLTGDVAGFAAAVYRRGVPVIQCPTTLLAMVDASVGGKTGVNLLVGDGPGGLKKNMVGAFHQPAAVLADLEALKSLPARELRAGLAECIKHGMLAADWGDAGLLEWTEANLDQILALDATALMELVRRNVAVKAAVVGKDEREESADGGRALLNLGHTFGHAIETIETLTPDGESGNAPLLHGEAVALGLVAACAAGAAAGRMQAEYGARVTRLLGRAGLPVDVRGLPSTGEVVSLMAHDKKVSGDALRLVVPCGAGRAMVLFSPDRAVVEAGIGAIRAE